VPAAERPDPPAMAAKREQPPATAKAKKASRCMWPSQQIRTRKNVRSNITKAGQGEHATGATSSKTTLVHEQRNQTDGIPGQ